MRKKYVSFWSYVKMLDVVPFVFQHQDCTFFSVDNCESCFHWQASLQQAYYIKKKVFYLKLQVLIVDFYYQPFLLVAYTTHKEFSKNPPSRKSSFIKAGYSVPKGEIGSWQGLQTQLIR